MNKALNAPQLSSAKPRSGLQSIASLIPRLIRQYEIQAEMRSRQNLSPPSAPVAVKVPHRAAQQATFAWYDS